MPHIAKITIANVYKSKSDQWFADIIFNAEQSFDINSPDKELEAYTNTKAVGILQKNFYREKIKKGGVKLRFFNLSLEQLGQLRAWVQFQEIKQSQEQTYGSLFNDDPVQYYASLIKNLQANKDIVDHPTAILLNGLTQAGCKALSTLLAEEIKAVNEILLSFQQNETQAIKEQKPEFRELFKRAKKAKAEDENFISGILSALLQPAPQLIGTNSLQSSNAKEHLQAEQELSKSKIQRYTQFLYEAAKELKITHNLKTHPASFHSYIKTAFLEEIKPSVNDEKLKEKARYALENWEKYIPTENANREAISKIISAISNQVSATTAPDSGNLNQPSSESRNQLFIDALVSICSSYKLALNDYQDFLPTLQHSLKDIINKFLPYPQVDYQQVIPALTAAVNNWLVISNNQRIINQILIEKNGQLDVALSNLIVEAAFHLGINFKQTAEVLGNVKDILSPLVEQIQSLETEQRKQQAAGLILAWKDDSDIMQADMHLNSEQQDKQNITTALINKQAIAPHYWFDLTELNTLMSAQAEANPNLKLLEYLNSNVFPAKFRTFIRERGLQQKDHTLILAPFHVGDSHWILFGIKIDPNHPESPEIFLIDSVVPEAHKADIYNMLNNLLQHVIKPLLPQANIKGLICTGQQLDSDTCANFVGKNAVAAIQHFLKKNQPTLDNINFEYPLGKPSTAKILNEKLPPQYLEYIAIMRLEHVKQIARANKALGDIVAECLEITPDGKIQRNIEAETAFASARQAINERTENIRKALEALQREYQQQTIIFALPSNELLLDQITEKVTQFINKRQELQLKHDQLAELFTQLSTIIPANLQKNKTVLTLLQNELARITTQLRTTQEQVGQERNKQNNLFNQWQQHAVIMEEAENLKKIATKTVSEQQQALQEIDAFSKKDSKTPDELTLSEVETKLVEFTQQVKRIEAILSVTPEHLIQPTLAGLKLPDQTPTKEALAKYLNDLTQLHARLKSASQNLLSHITGLQQMQQVKLKLKQQLDTYVQTANTLAEAVEKLPLLDAATINPKAVEDLLTKVQEHIKQYATLDQSIQSQITTQLPALTQAEQRLMTFKESGAVMLPFLAAKSACQTNLQLKSNHEQLINAIFAKYTNLSEDLAQHSAYSSFTNDAKDLAKILSELKSAETTVQDKLRTLQTAKASLTSVKNVDDLNSQIDQTIALLTTLAKDLPALITKTQQLIDSNKQLQAEKETTQALLDLRKNTNAITSKNYPVQADALFKDLKNFNQRLTATHKLSTNLYPTFSQEVITLGIAKKDSTQSLAEQIMLWEQANVNAIKADTNDSNVIKNLHESQKNLIQTIAGNLNAVTKALTTKTSDSISNCIKSLTDINKHVIAFVEITKNSIDLLQPTLDLNYATKLHQILTRPFRLDNANFTSEGLVNVLGTFIKQLEDIAQTSTTKHPTDISLLSHVIQDVKGYQQAIQQQIEYLKQQSASAVKSHLHNKQKLLEQLTTFVSISGQGIPNLRLKAHNVTNEGVSDYQNALEAEQSDVMVPIGITYNLSRESALKLCAQLLAECNHEAFKTDTHIKHYVEQLATIKRQLEQHNQDVKDIAAEYNKRRRIAKSLDGKLKDAEKTLDQLRAENTLDGLNKIYYKNLLQQLKTTLSQIKGNPEELAIAQDNTLRSISGRYAKLVDQTDKFEQRVAKLIAEATPDSKSKKDTKPQNSTQPEAKPTNAENTTTSKRKPRVDLFPKNTDATAGKSPQFFKTPRKPDEIKNSKTIVPSAKEHIHLSESGDEFTNKHGVLEATITKAGTEEDKTYQERIIVTAFNMVAQAFSEGWDTLTIKGSPLMVDAAYHYAKHLGFPEDKITIKAEQTYNKSNTPSTEVANMLGLPRFKDITVYQNCRQQAKQEHNTDNSGPPILGF